MAAPTAASAPSPASVTVEVTGEPLDITRYVALVSDPGAGAISTFSGVTRNNFQGKAVLRLEYEAYEPMAVKKLQVLGLSCVLEEAADDGRYLGGPFSQALMCS